MINHLEERYEKNVSDRTGDRHPEVLYDHDEVVLWTHNPFINSWVVPVDKIKIVQIDHCLAPWLTLRSAPLDWTILYSQVGLVTCNNQQLCVPLSAPLSLCAHIRSYFACWPLHFKFSLRNLWNQEWKQIFKQEGKHKCCDIMIIIKVVLQS